LKKNNFLFTIPFVVARTKLHNFLVIYDERIHLSYTKIVPFFFWNKTEVWHNCFNENYMHKFVKIAYKLSDDDKILYTLP